MSTTVRTQAELDAALASDETEILIDSPRGVWLTLTQYGSATVRAYGSATVRAYGSATVRAYGSATVRAYDSATVRAYGSATVEASKFVAVHLFSGRATVTGGVLIDLTALDLTDLATWIDYTGAQADGDDLILFKAVDADLKSGYGLAYPVGKKITDKKWRDDHSCGGGLHLSPTAAQAAAYFLSATRFLRCRVAKVDVRPIGFGETAKCKVPKLLVECEVDIHGRPL